PDGVIVALAGEVVGPIVADVIQVLVVTSMFACMLAFHNIVTRYLFTLGRRGVLPVSLGAVHATRRAPSHASLWVSGLTTAIVLVSVVAMLDPVTQIYTWYSGAGAVGVILMMALTSVAVVRFGSSGPDSAAGADGVAGAGGSAVADGSAGTGGPGGRAPVAVLLATGLGGLGPGAYLTAPVPSSRRWRETARSRRRVGSRLPAAGVDAHLAAGDEMFGDFGEARVGPVARRRQKEERLLRRDLVSFHEDAFRLTDHVSRHDGLVELDGASRLRESNCGVCCHQQADALGVVVEHVGLFRVQVQRSEVLVLDEQLEGQHAAHTGLGGCAP